MKKNVLITGASGNLGKATVERFLAEGYQVIATVTPGKTLSFVKDGSVDSVEADLQNEKQVEEVVERMVSKYKTIDVALFLVGGYAGGGIKTSDGALLRKMFSLNFETAYFAARPVFLQMQKQATGGRIVLIGARPALIPADGKKNLPYALAKSLLFRLAEFLNAEGAAQNVVTTVVVPSTIDTPANRESMPKADFSTWVKPEEIASIMAFVTSEQGSAVRETVVKVYGRA